MQSAATCMQWIQLSAMEFYVRIATETVGVHCCWAEFGISIVSLQPLTYQLGLVPKQGMNMVRECTWLAVDNDK